jgi:hypothetical protein
MPKDVGYGAKSAASDTLQKRDEPSLQSVAKRLRTVGVTSLKDLDNARKRAPGKRSSAKRALNQV